MALLGNAGNPNENNLPSKGETRIQTAINAHWSVLWLCVCNLLLCFAGCQKATDSQNHETDRTRDASVEADSTSEIANVTAANLIARGDYASAKSVLKSQLLVTPNDATTLELLGDAESASKNLKASILLYEEALANVDTPSKGLLRKLAQELLLARRPFDSIEMLETLIHEYPNDTQARMDLAGLAASVGLSHPTASMLRWLAQHGQGDEESLAILAEPERVAPDRAWCLKLAESSGDDSKIEYSFARLDAVELKWSLVAKQLESLLSKDGDFVAAFLLYGRALIELNDTDKLKIWAQQIPAETRQSPDYWVIAGMWAQNQGDHAQAARAFWEGLRLDSTAHTETLPYLLRSLNHINRPNDAQLVAAQVIEHAEMRDAVKIHFERKSESQSAAMRVADAMVKLGRIWEAEAWARLATSLDKDRINDIRSRYLAIRALLKVDTPWQLPERMIGNQIDLNDLPLLDWTHTPTKSKGSSSTATKRFYFQDEAKRRGWISTCAIAPEATKNGHWIYQTVGGGVGVIDFDLDGWPDLANAMLDGAPLQRDSSPNRLFRNMNGLMIDVGLQANYLDTGFSQGIAVGDYNEDGFPDIFDANIGRNCLYRNNGDGTFQEVSSVAIGSNLSWTTSVAIADINSDGIADIYETNYCRGSEPFEQACRNRKGLISTCPPLQFEPEQDRTLKGNGSGSFQDVTNLWLNGAKSGRGLGVVVGQFDERPGIDLYIANDMTVNHLWSSEVIEGAYGLAELGAVRGLGFNARSLSQASMGIASGDPDGDGDIDFLLTHFADDHNTFYEQVSPGFWSDRSFVLGLAEPSMKMLGFGTQFCDFDNDGTQELIIANGHVDDVEREDVAFRMPPQLFSRQPTGRWEEMDRNMLGDYFSTDHLGRSLAILDVNRDGLNDAAITHLFDPVSLLVNQTAETGSRIGLELKGTRSSRDAIGATVTCQTEQKVVSVQLTAGDGYMCSNQRRLQIGAGSSREVENIVVQWPSGATEKFGSLSCNRDYLLVEGSGTAFMLESPNQ